MAKITSVSVHASVRKTDFLVFTGIQTQNNIKNNGIITTIYTTKKGKVRIKKSKMSQKALSREAFRSPVGFLPAY